MRKPVFWGFPSRALQTQKVTRDLGRNGVEISEVLISCEVTGLICAFVFTYAKRFSHHVAHIKSYMVQVSVEWHFMVVILPFCTFLCALFIIEIFYIWILCK